MSYIMYVLTINTENKMFGRHQLFILLGSNDAQTTRHWNYSSEATGFQQQHC